MNVTKLDLCNRIARRMGKRSSNEVKSIMDTFFDETLKILSEGQRIEIRGFGAFSVRLKRSKIGRNPRTGETVDIPEHQAPIFKFSKEAKNNFDVKLKR